MLLLLLLTAACHGHPRAPEPDGRVAYRFTREDGTQCIMAYPSGRRSVQEIKSDCGCAGQSCVIEVIRLK